MASNIRIGVRLEQPLHWEEVRRMDAFIDGNTAGRLRPMDRSGGRALHGAQQSRPPVRRFLQVGIRVVRYVLLRMLVGR